MRRAVMLLAGLALAGCQNADLLRPDGEASEETRERAFTRVGDADPGELTSQAASVWFDRIRDVEGQARVERIDEFLAAYPAGRRLAVVHRMQADALAVEQRLGEAAKAYERALALTRTDVTRLPLNPELALQLALAQLSSGDAESGVDWLLRVSVADRSERVVEGLRWAFATHFSDEGPFEAWRSSRFAAAAASPPSFRLPGLLEESVGLDPDSGVTLVNFWSPT